MGKVSLSPAPIYSSLPPSSNFNGSNSKGKGRGGGVGVVVLVKVSMDVTLQKNACFLLPSLTHQKKPHALSGDTELPKGPLSAFPGRPSSAPL